jgi:hypothetical protein
MYDKLELEIIKIIKIKINGNIKMEEKCDINLIRKPKMSINLRFINITRIKMEGFTSRKLEIIEY